MKLEIKVEAPIYMPTRAHPTDAGLDLMSTENAIIGPGEKKLIDTGVAVKIPEGFVGLLFSRSGQGKYGIRLANSVGVIDSDYRGNIKVLLENNSEDLHYNIDFAETKVAQLVVVPILLPELEVVDEDNWNDTARGSGGFGSTGA